MSSLPTEPVVTELTAEQATLPPADRFRARMQNNEFSWRPNTRRYRLSGGIMEARMGAVEFVVFDKLVWTDHRRPLRTYKLAEMLREPVPTVTKAMAHLEKHGWVSQRDGKWILSEGSDCDCPPRVPPRLIDGVQIDAVGEQVALYRLYADGDVLLYVGITENLRGRMREHERVQPWWPEVARKTVAWYDNREKADLAETLAVAAENPLHNRAKLYLPKAAVQFEV